MEGRGSTLPFTNSYFVLSNVLLCVHATPTKTFFFNFMNEFFFFFASIRDLKRTSKATQRALAVECEEAENVCFVAIWCCNNGTTLETPKQ